MERVGSLAARAPGRGVLPALEHRSDAGIGEGADPESAQREVLEDFGDPMVVARSFATTRSGRLALPTRATRDAGVLAYVSAGLWIGFPAVWQVGGPDEHGDYLVANAAGFTIGSVILACGLIGIGRWLSGDEPVELPDPTHPSFA